MALIGCGICIISGMFLKRNNETQPEQLDPVDIRLESIVGIILADPRVLTGRGRKNY